MSGVYIISAPSGSGKSTLVDRVRQIVPGLKFSISYTTRAVRGDEQDGREYFFVSRAEFEEMIAKDEFLEHANDEQGHADQLAQRIVQLQGEPNFNPEGLLMRSHAEYVEGTTLTDMIKEDLVAERIAIDSYREMIQYFGNEDPTSRRMLEGILAVEEEHADDLVSLLENMG